MELGRELCELTLDGREIGVIGPGPMEEERYMIALRRGLLSALLGGIVPSTNVVAASAARVSDLSRGEGVGEGVSGKEGGARRERGRKEGALEMVGTAAAAGTSTVCSSSSSSSS